MLEVEDVTPVKIFLTSQEDVGSESSAAQVGQQQEAAGWAAARQTPESLQTETFT